ncbi:MAG TPA: response regulator, partial [Thermoanaerobaculia bacterium]|nr:response regulator [Thermoanaerobaculia bacterium]
MSEAPFLLLVEDNAKIRTNTLTQLRDDGLAAHAVESAEEALAFLAAATEPPDVLLVDVRLPGLSGIDLLRDLGSRGDCPPAIIISGEASIAETVEALRLGVYDLIEKPFTRERLLQSVRNCLEHVAVKR